MTQDAVGVVAVRNVVARGVVVQGWALADPRCLKETNQ